MKKNVLSAIQSCTQAQQSPETNCEHLDAEYRLIRAALADAGLSLTDSMDALYRDWRRWREKAKSLGGVDRERMADADQWWARHLAQFRSLIDPSHLAARAERARKDESVVRREAASSEDATPS